MISSLLTEGGKTGNKVVGACGFSLLTGEFYVFKARATVLSTMIPQGIWKFSTERAGLFESEPNAGSGYTLAWNAGAEFTLMEATTPLRSNAWSPMFGSGGHFATWYACTLVDNNGKEIPWVNRDGKILHSVSERYHTAPGQKFFLYTAPHLAMPYEYKAPSLITDLQERILKGEFQLPFYADLPGMPEHERKAIWGLMVGNEGLSRHLVYQNYSRAGFDPEKDMLEVEGVPNEANISKLPRPVQLGPAVRDLGFVGGYGGLVFDWDLKTSLEGLYAAGSILAGEANYSASICSGRFAGRKAAEYSFKAADPVIERSQIQKEKDRIYAPLKRDRGIEWQELQFQLNNIMQKYCPEYKNEPMLKMGLTWLNDIQNNEVETVMARNPHELQRYLECTERITTGEIVMQSSLLRKSSSRPLDFKRLDYPEMDPPEWYKFITVKRAEHGLKTGELPFNYWLLPPYAPNYRENYAQHSGI